MKHRIALDIELNNFFGIGSAADPYTWDWNLLISQALPVNGDVAVTVLKPGADPDPFANAGWVVCATFRTEEKTTAAAPVTRYRDEYAVYPVETGAGALAHYNKHLRTNDLYMACLARIVTSTDHPGAGQDYIDRTVKYTLDVRPELNGTSTSGTTILPGAVDVVNPGIAGVETTGVSRSTAATAHVGRTTQGNVPEAVVVAMRHVQDHFPDVDHVYYSAEGRWLYCEELEPVSFEKADIDTGLLEAAQNALETIPAAFYIPPLPKEVTVRDLIACLRDCNLDAAVYLDAKDVEADPESAGKRYVRLDYALRRLRRTDGL